MSRGEEIFRFDGRTGRPGYWRALISLGLVGSAPFSLPALYEPRLPILAYNLGYEVGELIRSLSEFLTSSQRLWPAFALLALLLLVSLTVRRLNDAGRSAWFVIALPAALLIGLFAASDGPNEYGVGPAPSLPRPLSGAALLVLLLIGFALFAGVAMSVDPSLGAPQ